MIGQTAAGGGEAAQGTSLTAAQFAAAAAGRRPVVTEQELELVREDELPPDWWSTTVDCYSTESSYYELAQYAHIASLKASVDGFVADQLVASAARAVLDVGVGDGHRLARICSLVEQRRGWAPQMFGIELSDDMLVLARRRGVHAVKQDMREGLAKLGREVDGIVFLSGDLGYLMDPRSGPELRRGILDSAHDLLPVGGRVVLELICRDPRTHPRGADIFHFSRRPTVRDEDGRDLFHGPETWQYIKTFSRPEVVALIKDSRFDLGAASLRYVVRDSPDLGRLGMFTDDDDIVADESYRLLVALAK